MCAECANVRSSHSLGINLHRLSLALSAVLALTSGASVAQSNTDVPRHFQRSISGCTAVENPVFFFGQATNAIPTLPYILDALRYKWRDGRPLPQNGKPLPFSSGVIEGPKGGSLKLYDVENHLYWYEGRPGFRGRDHAILWVGVGSKFYKLNLRIDVVGSIDAEDTCGHPPPREDGPSLKKHPSTG